MELIFTEEELTETAALLYNAFKNYKIWAFDAPMGAGKTTLINALCKDILRVEEVSSSPTFSIINEYFSKQYGKIIHMDWYRLKDEEEAFQAGVEDALYSGNLCLVEWPEKAAGLLPDDTLIIKMEVLDGNTRRITL